MNSYFIYASIIYYHNQSYYFFSFGEDFFKLDFLYD